jgi:DNA-binding protein H-NS
MGIEMNRADLIKLSTDELWKVYEIIAETLADRMLAEKQDLDAKLDLLNHQALAKTGSQPNNPDRRKYPKVPQKYRNPQEPSQTWSGRGKQPAWVTKLLRSGAKLDDLVMPEYRRLARNAA